MDIAIDVLKDIMPAFNFGEATKIHDRLGVIPIINDAAPGIIPLLTLLDETNGTVTIQEVNDAGTVPFLLLENTGDHPVLLLDGQQLLGGKQNRIINATIIALAGSRLRIPVACVERGRWDHNSRGFHSSNSVFRASGRAVHKQSVTASLRRDGVPAADQGSVWREVARSHAQFDVDSRTAAYQDVLENGNVSNRLDEFVESIQPIPNQVGAIFFDHKGVTGAEILATPDLFARSIDKIVRSFALDVLSAPPINVASPEPAVQWWLDTLELEYTKHPAVGVGIDIRVETPKRIASALVYGGQIIHASCFNLSEHQSEQPHRTSRSSASARRRNLLRLN